MIELSKSERHLIAHLCKTRKDDVVMWSCMEGNIGRVWVKSKEIINYAVLVAADFCFLLGKFEKVYYDALLQVLTEHCREKLIISEDKLLGSYIESQFLNSFRKFKRYAFNKQLTKFDKQLLKDFSISIEPEFTVIKMGELQFFQALQDRFTADF